MALAAAEPAQAAPTTFGYEGIVSRQESPFFDAGYAVGTPLIFTYTFDPDQITSTRWEGTPNASEFVYEWANGGWSFEMTVGTDTYIAMDSAILFDIRVENDVTANDRYGVRVRADTGQRFEFPNDTSSPLLQLFLAGDSDLFSDFSLPLVAPDAGGAVRSFFGAHLQASIDGPTTQGPVSDPPTVPAPGTLPLLAGGLVLFGLLRARRRYA